MAKFTKHGLLRLQRVNNIALSLVSPELMAEVKAAEKRREDTMEARVCQMERDREQFMRDVENAAVKTRDEKRYKIFDLAFY